MTEPTRSLPIRSDDSQDLARHPETNAGEVGIEGEGEANPGALHDGEADGIDGRKFMEISTPEIIPRLFQIPQLARKNFYNARLTDRHFPGQPDVSIGVSVYKCRRLYED